MIEQLLSDLKMLGALNFFNNLKEDVLSKEDFLIHILKSEINWKSKNKLIRRLGTASFPYEREWSQIERDKNIKINFKKIQTFSDGDFVDKKANLCFIGAPGLGKTHCLISIGRDLCRKGYSTKFYTAIDLVTKLLEAKKNNELSNLMEKITKHSLLIIDELGFVPLSDEGSRLLFDVFSKRYEKGSIAVSTNLSLPKWVQTFGCIELTNALIDRFTHKCDVFVFEGESYRYLESKESTKLEKINPAKTLKASK